MLEARLWLTKSNKNFLGKGRILLLEHIREAGSIHAAAKVMKMSYKAAWDAVDAMNNLADTPLVIRVSGGKGGGGTSLTPKAEEIITLFHTLEAKHQQFLELFSNEFDTLDNISSVLDRLPLKLSARNQLMGTISAIAADAVSVTLSISIKGIDMLLATITLQSFETLGISIHDKVIAIIKASSVIITTTQENNTSYENCLHGTIIQLLHGATHTEVTLEMESKSTITATLSNDTCKELALKVGQKAYASFKASSVILGV